MPNNPTRIDILIATDCISEGQNLQDCNYLINYDIHWNPVRIIQRFGRIISADRWTCKLLPDIKLGYIHIRFVFNPILFPEFINRQLT